jgi:hypothetical protein
LPELDIARYPADEPGQVAEHLFQPGASRLLLPDDQQVSVRVPVSALGKLALEPAQGLAP